MNSKAVERELRTSTVALASLAIGVILAMLSLAGPTLFSASLSKATGTLDHGLASQGATQSQVAITQEGQPHFFPTVSTSRDPPKTPAGVLTYGGGPVMHDPTIYLVFWEPSGFSYDTGDTGSLSATDAMYENVMKQFFLSASNSSWMGIAQQYPDGSGAPGTQVTVGGTIIDTNPFPCGACGSGNALQDSQVQTEINNLITTDNTPSGTNVEYFVYLPLNVYECFSTSCSFTSFCAYHDWFTSGTVRVYAVMPDLGTDLSVCSLGGQLQTTYPFAPNGDNYADATANVNSHEFMESITDPEYPNGWDSSSGEIGDLCAWSFGPAPYQDEADVEYSGHPYYVQYEYSNNISGCYLPPLPATPAPSIAVTTSATTVEAGQVVYINATGGNTGTTAAWENMTVSVTGVPSSALSVFSTTLPSTPAVIPVGSTVRGCYWLCTATTTYGEVDGQAAPWAGGSSYTMSVAFTPPVAGTYTVNVKATAANGVASYTSNWAPTSGSLDQDGEYVTSSTITVNPGPLIAQPAATPATIDVGQTVHFSTSLISPGTGTDTFGWSASSPAFGCAPSSSLFENCTPTAAGTYTVTAMAKDSLGGVGRNTSVAYVVHAHPTLSVPTAVPTSIDNGSGVVFSATLTSPGSGSDVYRWSVAPATGLSCGASTTLSLSCTSSLAGMFNVTVTATDSNGGTGNSTLPFRVYPTPTVSAPVPSPASADVGQAVSFTTSVTRAGSGGDTFSWNSPGAGLGCLASNSTVLSCTPSAPGTYSVNVSVNDTNGGRSNASSSPYRVFPDPTVSAPTAPAGPETGVATTFTTALTNPGSGGDTYTWSATPSGLGCSPSTTLSVACTPTVVGTYHLQVTVKDSNGGTGTAAASTVLVTLPLLANGTATPSSGASPLTVNFAGTATGGTAPYTYSWRFGDGATATSQTQNSTHNYGSAGSYTAVLFVNDSKGHTATKTFAITVSKASPFAFVGFLPGGIWGLLLIALVVGAVIALVVARHRRRRAAVVAAGGEAVAPWPTQGYGASGPGYGEPPSGGYAAPPGYVPEPAPTGPSPYGPGGEPTPYDAGYPPSPPPPPPPPPYQGMGPGGPDGSVPPGGYEPMPEPGRPPSTWAPPPPPE